MSWRLTQPVLVTLVAVAWPNLAAGATAPTRPHVSYQARVERRAAPSRAPREGDSPWLRQAGPPMACALSAERPGQLRIDLRQPGMETWLGPVACAATARSPTYAQRLGRAATTWSGPRLNVLLCTWLI